MLLEYRFDMFLEKSFTFSERATKPGTISYTAEENLFFVIRTDLFVRIDTQFS